MKSIPLTRGKFSLVDDEDFEWLSQWKWCYSGRYAVRNIPDSLGGGMVYMHREILKTPDGFHTDHADGNRLNNQRYNLRICTARQNLQNQGRSKRNKSGFKGVSFQKGGYRAVIVIDGKYVHIGRASSAEEAAKMYDTVAKEAFGEFARLNFD